MYYYFPSDSDGELLCANYGVKINKKMRLLHGINYLLSVWCSSSVATERNKKKRIFSSNHNWVVALLILLGCSSCMAEMSNAWLSEALMINWSSDHRPKCASTWTGYRCSSTLHSMMHLILCFHTDLSPLTWSASRYIIVCALENTGSKLERVVLRVLLYYSCCNFRVLDQACTTAK